MKLLSLSLVAHDANAALFDGARVRYVKFERPRQQKRFRFGSPSEWRRAVTEIFEIDVADCDDISITFDPAALPAHVAPLLFDAATRLRVGQSVAEALDPRVCAALQMRSAWWLSHHYCHALSGWMIEAAPPDVAIVVDGVGDGRAWSVCRGETLQAWGDIRDGSIGWGMREAGKALGLKAGHFNDLAGKVMGIAAYGHVDPAYLDPLRGLPSARLDQLWSLEAWQRWRGDALVGNLSLLDWVATAHQRSGEWLLELFETHARHDERIAYSGGVAQNVVWNALLRERFPGLTVAPHCSDEGLSLGGLEWLRRRHGLPLLLMPDFPFAQTGGAVPAPAEETIELAAQWLAEGRVIGWYQGAGEVGPRALGHRSILMDPRRADGRARIDQVKRREAFRPYGASVLEEDFDRYFAGAADGFMLYSCRVTDPALTAIRHVDGSCRVQRVGRECQPLRALLEGFRARTGCAVLLNTSLNVAGKPLAGWPDDARRIFSDTPIDAMFIGDQVTRR